MRSSLPNTNIVYDGPRKEEMQEFLDFMYEIRKQNPNMIFTGDTVYSQLRDRGLPRSERDEFGKGLDVRRFFDRWQNDFKGRKTWTGVTRNFWYWFQFVNGTRDEKEFIKLYIPINMPHLYEGVKQLFDFIDREGIQHQSKVGQNMRIDNVIVRLKKGDIASANKIIDFINNNPYLRTGLNKNNQWFANCSLSTTRFNKKDHHKMVFFIKPVAGLKVRYIATKLPGSTSSRFCKHQRSEIVAIDP